MPRFKKRDRDRFPALEIHEQYYGFSKVVTDPWKNHNVVRGYRCSGGDLHGMMGTWFTS
jgi:hypothetical protein